jgi:hypothetical protein
MNRHSNPEQNETEARDSQNINYGNMPYDSMQEHSMYQGGMQAQMNGRPMICYPMYGNAMHYGSQMGENQGWICTDKIMVECIIITQDHVPTHIITIIQDHAVHFSCTIISIQCTHITHIHIMMKMMNMVINNSMMVNKTDMQ